MKKKNLALLKLTKNKISNLNRLRSLVGGTDTFSPPTENNPITEQTNCNQNTCTSVCQTYSCTENPSCDTNDTIRSLGDPTLFATGSIGIGSNADC